MRTGLLLEIGTEELPVSSISAASLSLENSIREVLTKGRVEFGKISVYATPRRIVLHIEDIAQKQKDESKTLYGPNKDAAYDEKGVPTKALLGFLKSNDAKPEDVKLKATERGEKVYIEKLIKGLPTKTVLPIFIPEAIKGILFQKRMRWDGSGTSFSRPIRWILCLFDGGVIKFEFAGVRSGNRTYGLRHGKKPFASIKNPAEYFRFHKKEGIILNALERRKHIEDTLKKLAHKLSPAAGGQGAPAWDEALLDEVSGLVEAPNIFLCSFEDTRLHLPEDVLLASMAKYQRVFAFKSKDGKILPKFAGVVNIKGDTNLIRKNYEWVLNARLKDAAFFFKEDSKKPIKERLDDLSGVLYFKDLGSVLDKSHRLSTLCEFLAEKLNLDASSVKAAAESGRLSKCDLTTDMVREFPSLQGVMGKYYGEISGLSIDVTEAIGEHYLPRFTTDALPKTKIGCVVSLCDKLDLLVGAFGVGEIPTGSFDPYALRRAAYGFARIASEKGLSFSVSELISMSLGLYKRPFKIKEDVLRSYIMKFFEERLKAIFVEKGLPSDIIDAVLSSGFDDFSDVALRLEALSKVRKSGAFINAAKILERTSNILKGAKGEEIKAAVDEKLFKEPLEGSLWHASLKTKAAVDDALSKKDYAAATIEYQAGLFDLVHEFFDKVLVNAEDAQVRSNRLSLMKAINSIYADKVANLAVVKI